MSFVLRLLRALALGMRTSKLPTGLTSLSKVHVAVVFLDADEHGAEQLVGAVSGYFAAKKIRAEIFALTSDKHRQEIKGAHLLGPRNLTLIGRVRHNKRTPIVELGEELFVNLAPEGAFTAEYCAARSKALFKVGRAASAKKIYNLFVSSEGHSAADVFAQITGVLDTVK
ncbi:MAG: hypothetical protein J5748_06335 [Bacteroidales bacterium]|nr:hypothetical protein [Bacteroidales bacterium]